MEYLDEELGKIVFRKNNRAKRFIFRTKPDCVQITVPEFVSWQETLQALEQYREKLLAKKILIQLDLLDETTHLQTNTFSVHIFRSERANFYFSLKDQILHIACPNNTDFSLPEVQQFLRKHIEGFLRIEAKRFLPNRLQELAKEFRFKYEQVKINGSKGRWGSCSSEKRINLSFYLMLLPDHLIDYVLLHELTHTLEMNHSVRFWEKLDAVTNNRAHELRHELKKYKTRI